MSYNPFGFQVHGEECEKVRPAKEVAMSRVAGGWIIQFGCCEKHVAKSDSEALELIRRAVATKVEGIEEEASE